MKTPDEIKKDIIDCLEEAIEVGNTGDAHDLLAFSDKAYVCIVTARAYIRQLEADNASKDERIQMLEAGMEQWHDVAASPGAAEDMARENYRLTQELAAEKRERDAAVAGLKKAAALGKVCIGCIHVDCEIGEMCQQNDFDCWNCHPGCVCKGCVNNSLWQWRGVCPENTEVQEDA